jgi:peptide/nickel transport system substrate-binding protein
MKLRRGLKYSDGTPVRAGDFEHAVERVLALASPGSSFFMGVVGAPGYVARKRHGGGLPGIVTDDATGTITIRLSAPDGTFPNVLAMVFGAPVPRSTPFTNRVSAPPPGVGAYKYGRVRPGQDFVLERNPRFDLPGIPKAGLAPITVKIEANLQRQAEDVLRSDLDYMQDPPPPDLLPRVRSEAPGRYRDAASPTTVFFFLNHRTPPFDDARVRQAAEYALDRDAAARVYGGLLEPACNVLPPGVPGSEPVAPCPWSAAGGPALERARALVEAAGARGAKVSVWAPKAPPGDRLATVYADSLRAAGLDARPKLVDFAQYVQLIASPRTAAQMGLVVYSQDFPHPADFLGQFSGSTITPTGNANFGNVSDPSLTAAIDKLSQSESLARTAPAWAEVDRKLVERAHVVPVGFQKQTTFVSDRLKLSCVVTSPVYGNDYSSFCRK